MKRTTVNNAIPKAGALVKMGLCILLSLISIPVVATHWSVNTSAYSKEMIVHASLYNGTDNLTAGNAWEVAAFVGNECRGVGVLNTSFSISYLALRVMSNTTNETVTFRAYNAETAQEVVLDNSLTFDGAQHGTLSALYKLTMPTVKATENVVGECVITGHVTELNKGALSTSLIDASSLTKLDVRGVVFDASVSRNDVFSTLNPNCLIYADASFTLSDVNVVVGGVASHLLLTDKQPFKAPESFTATQTVYSRDNVDGLNSVCLPFKLRLSQLPVGSIIYRLRSVNLTAGTIGFDNTVTEMPANEPCLVFSPAGTGSWNIVLSDADIPLTPQTPQSIALEGGATLFGSYTTAVVGEAFYKLNAAGTKFGLTTSAGQTFPFRAYLKVTGTSSKELALDLNGEVDGLERAENVAGNVTVYRSDGSFVGSGKRAFVMSGLSRGLYIVNRQLIYLP